MRAAQLLCFIVSFTLGVSFASVGHTAALAKSRHLCARVQTGYARCFADVVTDEAGVQPLTAGVPRGYGPADFKQAYGGHGMGSAHVAVVTAYDAPTIEADLAVYSRNYGLSVPGDCGVNVRPGCFEKLNQFGTASLPPPNSSWSVETSLDVETIHGLCPKCSLSLIEARSSSINDLTAAVDTAVARGASVISNSYGGPEFAMETTLDEHYNRRGVTIVVSSGDSGYGTTYPAAAPTVVAVGGTSLQLRGGQRISETAWLGAGSGCSQYVAKPAWQHDSRCPRRSIADVAADADPLTGAAIYASYGHSGRGWMTLGGTSLAAPIISGLLASGHNSSNLPSRFYDTSAVGNLRDIAVGNNGRCRSYFCLARNGYDGPTGLGVLFGW